MATNNRFDIGARSGPTRFRAQERTLLRGFAAVAVAVGTSIALSTITRIIETLSGSRLTLGVASSVEIPADSAVGTATLISGTFDHALVTVENIDFGSRLLLAGSALSSGLAQIAIAALFTFVVLRLARSGPVQPFGRRVTWLLATGSVTLIAGGLLSYALGVAAQLTVVAQLDPDPNGTAFPFTSTSGDFTIVIVGLVLGVAAAIFEVGERLQRDTEGLI